MSRWYGSLTNRLEENKMYCDEIMVGTGVTEYDWSDRTPYEVIEVKDQKHVTVRGLDHRHVGDGCMDNNWELFSNPDMPIKDLVKIGDKWYWTRTIRSEELPEEIDPETRLGLAVGGWDLEKIRTKGKQTKRYRANVSFGTASYYYDYSF